MFIDSVLYKEIVDFLINMPILQNEKGRRALLLNAGLQELIPKIDCSGNANNFVSLLIEQLDTYGTLSNGQEALISFLDEIKSELGINHHKTLISFCERIKNIEKVEVKTKPKKDTTKPKINDNPFVLGGTITDIDKFWGRKDYIREIYQAIRSGQSLSIVGERMIGKSSLLNYICKTYQNELQGNFQIISMDLQDIRYKTVYRFLTRFLGALKSIGLDDKKIDKESDLLDKLMSFSDELEKVKNIKIVLLLDEFESILKKREEFTEDFFEHFRSILNARKLVMITASKHPLFDLCTEENLTSPFYNVFQQQNISEFTEDEAIGFVEHHSNLFDKIEKEFILTHLECHPLKLQILCSCVLDNKYNEKPLNNRELLKCIEKKYKNKFPKS